MNSAKAKIFETLKAVLLSPAVGIRTVERCYAQYENQNMSANYPAFNKSVYIDIYDLQLRQPQKGNRLNFDVQLDLYLNTIVQAQSLSIANSEGIFNPKSLEDWELEQKIITTLHDFVGNGITEMKFTRSMDFEKYDQLFVKKISFTLLTCAV
jgi:hypothetical protein